MNLICYSLGLIFYIQFLLTTERMARESHSTSAEIKASWLAIWREHRRAFPESGLRRKTLACVAMMVFFVIGGTIL